MIKKITFVVLLLLFGKADIIAQEIVNSSAKTTKALLSPEKVYLHTDRSYYNIGETLWYKAYLTNAYTTVLTENSSVLYVELVSPDSKIVVRNKSQLKYGLGNGDIILSDSIGVKPGTYQLRAYTNWMRNFDDDFLFKKEIEIIDLAQQKTDVSSQKNELTKKMKSKETIKVVPQNAIDVQFFPEGGSLIEGVSSMVAFKVTDKNGLPVEVEGRLLDTEGNEVTPINTEHDGMGKFIFTPNENMQYVVELPNLANEITTFQMPQSLNEGYVLAISTLKGKHIVTIKTNQNTLDKNLNKQLAIYFSTRGVNYFEGGIYLKKLMTSILLPEEKLPVGIVQITLTDDESKPHAERLFYVEKQSNLDIKMQLNKAEFMAKEKVNISISMKDTLQNPIIGSFSITAVDSKSLNTNANEVSDISSYFLMESDIKGKVFNPGYYFNIENADRIKHLDLLLLTQGWRDFLWKKVRNLKDAAYTIEKGIGISGSVKKLFSSGIKESNRVSLFYLNNGRAVFKLDTTDVNGRFSFDNLNFVGPTEIRLNVRNKNNKSGGMFLLDSVSNEPMKIDFKGQRYFDTSKLANTQRIKENIQQKFIEFDVPLSNRLKEILIVGQSTKENENKYGYADYTYDANKEPTKFSSTYDLIQFTIPGVVIFNDSISFRRNNGATAMIMVDDMEISSSDVGTIPASSVERIEGLNSVNATSFGTKGVNGVILIYTKSGAGVQKEKVLYHTINKKFEGFYGAKVFYSPNYDKPSTDWEEKSDVRNTLYWNPYVFSNKSGEMELNYFNSEVPTKVIIQMEGLTLEGIPVVYKTNYEIIEKN